MAQLFIHCVSLCGCFYSPPVQEHTIGSLIKQLFYRYWLYKLSSVMNNLYLKAGRNIKMISSYIY